ncbi:MAG: M56 family metallopeptidase, partial [Clostridia bacterium]|nr:M56 family metallopeptidase [Clostridia bacterium]
MSAVFLKILYMSAAGSAAIVLALLLRFAFRRGAKWIPLLLWGVVGLRLLIPFFLESGLGVLPGPEKLNEAFSAATAATVTSAPAEASAPAGIDQTEAAFTLPPEATARPATERPNETPLPSLSAEPTEAAKTTAKPAAVIGGTSEGGSPWLKTAGFIWAAGVSIMLAYAAASYFALRKKLMTATVCGGAYESEFIDTPFLLGVFRPRIYVPYGLSERQRQHVLAHERAHIRALDQVWKPLGFAALALHWFNPLCWLAFALFSKDLELACDERAAAGLSNNERADYCQTVLELSAKSRKLAAFPLSFGEAGAKERIKNLMNYKKMKLWAAALAVLSAALLCGCFLNGKQKKEEPRFMTITAAVSLADENGWV